MKLVLVLLGLLTAGALAEECHVNQLLKWFNKEIQN